METPPSPTDAGMSPDQFKQALWSDGGMTVYAVLIGDRVPDLQQRLETAGVGDWDRLWTGELDAAEKLAAPTLVALERGAEFSNWLIESAFTELGSWGLLLLSSRSFMAVRQCGRNLCEAILPDGNEIRLDWMDPEVALALLPIASSDQLGSIFGHLQALVVPQPQGWSWMRLGMGRLEQRSLKLLSKPA